MSNICSAIAARDDTAEQHHQRHRRIRRERPRDPEGHARRQLDVELRRGARADLHLLERLRRPRAHHDHAPGGLAIDPVATWSQAIEAEDAVDAGVHHQAKVLGRQGDQASDRLAAAGQPTVEPTRRRDLQRDGGVAVALRHHHDRRATARRVIGHDRDRVVIQAGDRESAVGAADRAPQPLPGPWSSRARRRHRPPGCRRTPRRLRWLRRPIDHPAADGPAAGHLDCPGVGGPPGRDNHWRELAADDPGFRRSRSRGNPAGPRRSGTHSRHHRTVPGSHSRFRTVNAAGALPLASRTLPTTAPSATSTTRTAAPPGMGGRRAALAAKDSMLRKPRTWRMARIRYSPAAARAGRSVRPDWSPSQPGPGPRDASGRS